MRISSASSTVSSSRRYSRQPSWLRRIIWLGPIPFSFIGSTPMISFDVVEICHLYISCGHNFVGHHGRKPDEYAMVEVPTVECLVGRGLRETASSITGKITKAKSHFSHWRFLTNFAALCKSRAFRRAAFDETFSRAMSILTN